MNKCNDIPDITTFIKQNDIHTIKSKLLSIMQHHNCKLNYKKLNILATGGVSNIYEPDQSYKYHVKNKEYTIDYLVKKSISKYDKPLMMNIIDNVLYIHGLDNITSELIIMMLVQPLLSKTLHLPLLLGYHMQSNHVKDIYILRYGLKERYVKHLEDTILIKNVMQEIKPKFSSYIETIGKLFNYIEYNKKGGNITLPNGITCKIHELFDTLCFSYISTYYLLSMNGIYLYDMVPKNIFIQWLDKDSYYQQESISNLKYIIYQVNGNYYKMKTFGLLLILGDIGNSIAHIKDDVVIIGSVVNFKDKVETIKKHLKYHDFSNLNFILQLKKLISTNDYKKTMIYKIFENEPYLSYVYEYTLDGFLYEFIHKMKKTDELFGCFEPYQISRYVKTDTNLLITIE
jgi:hypothetical protein